MNSNPNRLLDFAFCVNDAYVSYVCVTIKSILETHSIRYVRIHILTDFISLKSSARLDQVFQEYRYAEYQIHVIDKQCLPDLTTLSWSKIAWFRILLPTILPTEIKRVLYLDADTLVLKDLSELFSLGMEDIAIAGTIDPESFHQQTYLRCGYDSDLQYLCSGVLLMNLDYWRQKDIARLIIDYAKEKANNLLFPDQDAINYVCRHCKIILPLRFGIIGAYFTNEHFYQKPYSEELRSCLLAPSIIHYAGQAPWKREWANHFYQKEWEKYNQMLRHPAKRHYLTSGWPLVKMLAWNLLHAKERRKKHISKDVIISRIDVATQNDS